MPTSSRHLLRARIGISAFAMALCVSLSASILVPSAWAATGPGFSAGTYGEDSSPTGYDIKRATGFNTVYMGVTLGGLTGARTKLDALNALGMKAVIYTGSFDRAVECRFERDD